MDRSSWAHKKRATRNGHAFVPAFRATVLPRTAAGRALLEFVHMLRTDVVPVNTAHVRDRILAIEAEAAQPAPGLDVPTLRDAMQQTRLGPNWDRFRAGYVGGWPGEVAERYARLRVARGPTYVAAAQAGETDE
jgi:hypothetical protein